MSQLNCLRLDITILDNLETLYYSEDNIIANLSRV